MNSNSQSSEVDPRFPSGKWVGFFLDRRLPGKHQMEMVLTFKDGKVAGGGRDRVGEFAIAGSYEVIEGKCSWTKKYRGEHSVDYSGFNEGRGIWGTWSLTGYGNAFTGGFMIWPEGMPDPTVPRLEEEADVPLELEIEVDVPPIKHRELTPVK